MNTNRYTKNKSSYTQPFHTQIALSDVYIFISHTFIEMRDSEEEMVHKEMQQTVGKKRSCCVATMSAVRVWIRSASVCALAVHAHLEMLCDYYYYYLLGYY